ncbi:aliphatic nitrilase [Colletotrichum tabaci]|uniref:Aliphatic nitrilase n=1 Tax=Colletotrichum tabaci TaxID=1209068 RepID=A0AAV9SVZ1_9PEZI
MSWPFANPPASVSRFYPGMAFNMYVHRDHVRLAPSPYFANAEEDDWVNTGAVYSVLSKGYSFSPAVGASLVTGQSGTRVAISASIFDPSGLDDSVTQEIDGQA